MTAINGYDFARKGALLLAGTILSGVPAFAQTAPAASPSTAPAEKATRNGATRVAPPVVTPVGAPVSVRTIKTLRVEGS